VCEGDVVLLGPACEHVFLGDEAMVVASATPFILQVRHTLVGPPRLVVVVGYLLGAFFSEKTKKKSPIG